MTHTHTQTPAPANMTTHSSDIHIVWRLALLARQAAAALMVAATLAACVADDDAAMTTPAGAGAAAISATEQPDAPIPADLYRFALNAFLVPLLDDSDPPRWNEVALDFGCEPGTTVLIDGEPMVTDRPIPTKAFTVRWKMDRCSPLGLISVELSGVVELLVSHTTNGLSAIVTPDGLRVDSHLGRAWLQGPFTAETSLTVVAYTGRQ